MNTFQNNLKLPLISVIIPAYNAENFIAQTLESVLFQTYQNLEILVV
ncbi:MAG: glycosyltransferase family 2 protein, partial [Microcoleus sp.]